MKSLIHRKNQTETKLSRRLENPFEGLHRQMNNLFEDFFQDFGTARWPTLWRHDRGVAAATPKFEVAESDAAIHVTAGLPGMDEKDIEVTLDNNLLTVKGEKKQEHEEKKKNYYFSERSYGSFQRVVSVPKGIDKEKVQAQFKKGVLEITLPKTEQARSERKRIAVKSE